MSTVPSCFNLLWESSGAGCVHLVHGGLSFILFPANYAELPDYKVSSSVNEMVNSTKRIIFLSQRVKV